MPSGTTKILSGVSVSAPIDTRKALLAGFIMPSAWTAAALSVEVSADDATPSNWAALQDGLSAAYPQIGTPAVGVAYSLDQSKLRGWNWVRFRSGTTASPVNQAAERSFVITSTPMP